MVIAQQVTGILAHKYHAIKTGSLQFLSARLLHSGDNQASFDKCREERSLFGCINAMEAIIPRSYLEFLEFLLYLLICCPSFNSLSDVVIFLSTQMIGQVMSKVNVITLKPL